MVMEHQSWKVHLSNRNAYLGGFMSWNMICPHKLLWIYMALGQIYGTDSITPSPDDCLTGRINPRDAPHVSDPRAAYPSAEPPTVLYEWIVHRLVSSNGFTRCPSHGGGYNPKLSNASQNYLAPSMNLMPRVNKSMRRNSYLTLAYRIDQVRSEITIISANC